ncbi:MAG: BMP family protein [SAR324 cluster bacterium]|nr:BMP family protein [SAR324 cluster bacterium]
MKKAIKYSFQILLVAILFFVSVPGPVSANRPNQLKVALLTPGPINDKGWSQSGYEGLKLIEKELNAEIAYSEDIKEHDDIVETLRKHSKQGSSFIIGLGGRYVKGGEIVAKEFPRIKFAVVTAYAGNNRNLGALSFSTNEGTYLVGSIAAIKTKSKRVSIIYGKDHPQQKKAAESFVLGVKTIDPTVQTSIRWVGSWYDVEKSKAIAIEEIEAGSDVMHVSTDQGDKHVFEIVEKANIFATGSTIDSNRFAPGNILTSIIQDVPTLMLEAAKIVRLGRWEGKQYKFGLEKNVVRLAPFYGLLTETEEQTVQDIIKRIKLGQIEVSP